jgi:hypothetical protein
MPQQYLSTDPNAGLDGGYISTDPNAGDNDNGGTSGAPAAPLSPGLALGATMALAPAAVSLAHRGANLAGKAVASRGMLPAAIVGSVVDDLARGDVRSAAKDAASAAVGAYATQKVAAPIVSRIAQATAPARTVPGVISKVLDARGVPYQSPPTTIPGGVLSRAAGALSRAAGPVGLAVETMFGDGVAGHRPHDETAATTAARQEAMARDFVRRVNAEAGYTVIDAEGKSLPEVIEAIARYRAGR